MLTSPPATLTGYLFVDLRVPSASCVVSVSSLYRQLGRTGQPLPFEKLCSPVYAMGYLQDAVLR